MSEIKRIQVVGYSIIVPEGYKVVGWFYPGQATTTTKDYTLVPYDQPNEFCRKLESLGAQLRPVHAVPRQFRLVDGNPIPVPWLHGLVLLWALYGYRVWLVFQPLSPTDLLTSDD